jgi:hypothetical protein
MTPIFKSTFAALAISLVALSAQAQGNPATPGVDKRQAVQQARIEQGVASGQLTPREARRLQREQRAVRHAEAQAKSDGAVTPAERRRLHRMQNQASRDIRHQKHDAQVAPAK